MKVTLKFHQRRRFWRSVSTLWSVEHDHIMPLNETECKRFLLLCNIRSKNTPSKKNPFNSMDYPENAR